jgi:hypothetical protein
VLSDYDQQMDEGRLIGRRWTLGCESLLLEGE